MIRTIAVLLLVLTSANEGYGHTGDTYFAANEKITVDGDLSDWGDGSFVTAPYYTRSLVDPDSEKDFHVAFSVAWDGKTIYLAAKVRDDLHRNTMDIFRTEGDHVRFTFQESHTRSTWGRHPGVTLALSSVDGAATAEPKEMVTCAIIRDDVGGVTVYEAAYRVDEKIRAGDVTGFSFVARENDGFPDGSYASSPEP